LTLGDGVGLGQVGGVEKARTMCLFREAWTFALTGPEWSFFIHVFVPGVCRLTIVSSIVAMVDRSGSERRRRRPFSDALTPPYSP
jgi:hypothetical protein